MNKDIFSGKSKQAKGEIKKMWGKLTDDEIEQSKGDIDILVGKIRENYGESKEEIREKLNGLLKSIKSKDKH